MATLATTVLLETKPGDWAAVVTVYEVGMYSSHFMKHSC